MIAPIIPTDMDVLCGKDKACLQAKGSKHFRDVIDSYVPRYTTCKSKFEKMVATREIYEVVSKESRFLKFNETEKVWEEISAMAARDKIGHSLRFSSRAKRRHLKKKPQHSRTGSGSSHSSANSNSTASTVPSSVCENDTYTMDSLVGLLQSAAANEPVVEEVSSTAVDSAPLESSSSLDDFLLIEFSADLQSETDILADIGEFKFLFEDDQQAAPADPLISFMDDILSVVNDIEENELEGEEENLTTLLSEPVGEWEEDCSVQL